MLKMLGTLQQYTERLWWGVLAYSIAMKYVIYELFGRKIGRFKGLQGIEFPRNDGRMAIVTGGSRGIGLEIVKNLLETGYAVVIGSSANAEIRQKLVESLKKKFPNQIVEVWHLDLASQKSVVAFAEKYLSTELPLHLLINNAGIMFVKQEITEDGYEKHFAVNYLSHCLLTLLLLPLLSKSGSTEKKSRIINCTSCIHYAGIMDIKSLLERNYYSKYRAYIESKLAQVMFTYSLQSYLDDNNINITVNCTHPGIVNTELMTKVLLLPSLGSVLFKSAKEGAETTTYAALSSDIEGIGGIYFEECKPVVSSKFSREKHRQKELWEQTLAFIMPHIRGNSTLFSKNMINI